MVTRTAIKEAASLTRERAIEKLNSLLAQAEADSDTKAALAVQKELNKLHGLYQPQADTDDDDGDSAVLAAIREHLEPLELGPPETPVEELARLAALRILNQ
jgi:hypothetical protein